LRLGHASQEAFGLSSAHPFIFLIPSSSSIYFDWLAGLAGRLATALLQPVGNVACVSLSIKQSERLQFIVTVSALNYFYGST
jgi:hypothetical protein